MAIIIKDKEIADLLSFIGVEQGEEIKDPVEFSGCTFTDEIDLVNKQFERWLSFKHCVFEKPLMFGRTDSHLHSSRLKQDLVFKECVFEDKACFDGIECDGSITFDHCFFRYKSNNKQDFSLSLQAVTVKIQLAITDCDITGGGLSLNSAKVDRVGCCINHVRLLSERGCVDFRGAHLGDEFAIQGSELICNGILFELVSVNAKGHVMVEGKTVVPSMSTQSVVFRVLNGWALDNSCCLSANEDESIRDCLLLYYYHDGKINYVIINDNNCYKLNTTENNTVEDVKNAFISNDSEFLRLQCTDSNILKKDNIEELKTKVVVPLVERWILVDGSRTKGFLCVGMGEVYYKKETETDYIVVGDVFDGLAPFFLPDEYSQPMERVNCGDFDCYIKGNMNHTFMVSNIVYGYKGEFQTIISLSIPTQLHSSELVSFVSMKCGCRLHFANTLFFAPALYFDRLSAADDVIIEQSNIRTYTLSFRDVKSDSIRIEMDTINYGGTSQSNKGWSSVGMDLEGTEARKMQFKHLHVGTPLKVENIVFSLRDTHLNDQYIIENIYCHGSTTNGNPNIMVDLRDSKIRCFRNFDLLTQSKVYYLITGMDLEEIRLMYDKGNYLPDTAGKIYKLIDNKVFVGNAVPLLRTIEKLYEENDKQDIANGIWKYRNKLRIKQKYSKPWSNIVIWWNNWFTDYGLTTWKLLLWLIGLMLAFDVYALCSFHLSVGSSIANGFVEFIPINFNSPVVEAIRGNYGKNLNSFGYGLAVILYRLISYILLSVLIASLTGYFNKKNK